MPQRRLTLTSLLLQATAATVVVLVSAPFSSYVNSLISSAPASPTGATSDLEWREVSSSSQIALAVSVPPARSGASLVDEPLLRGLLLIGGSWHYQTPYFPYFVVGSQVANTWLFSSGRWTNVTSSVPSPPSSLLVVSLAYDPALNGIVLLGDAGSPCYTVNSCASITWLFSNGRWANITDRSTLHPPGRVQPSMVYDPAENAILLFGGRHAIPSGSFNDTWELRGVTWLNVTSPRSPAPRFGAAFGYDPETGAALLVGGSAYVGPALVQATVPDAWTFVNGNWTNVTATDTPAVPATSDLSFDPGTNSMILYGADGLGTWELGAQQWTMIGTAPSPPPRSWASFACDAKLQGCILFGGIASGGNGFVPVLGDAWVLASPVIVPLTVTVLIAMPIAGAATAALCLAFSARALRRSMNRLLRE